MRFPLPVPTNQDFQKKSQRPTARNARACMLFSEGVHTNEAGATPDVPTVSVVIPTRDRPDKVRLCLEALMRQRFPRQRFEVIVVDDGSRDSLEPVVGPFRDRLRIRLIAQQNAGPARARNVGAAHAAGAVLAFTDDDCEPDEGWVAAADATLRQHPNDVVGGCVVNALPRNPYSAASQLLVDYLYDYYVRSSERSGGSAAPPFFTSNNFAMSRDLFRSVGGFDESFPLAAGEDRELCDRIQTRGHELKYRPELLVRHAHPLTLRRYWRQHFNYGRGAAHLRRARASQGLPPVRLEPVPFYVGLLTSPLRAPVSRSRTLLIGLLLLSQVANVIGFHTERRRGAPLSATR